MFYRNMPAQYFENIMLIISFFSLKFKDQRIQIGIAVEQEYF